MRAFAAAAVCAMVAGPILASGAVAAPAVEVKQIEVDKIFPFLANYYGLAATARDKFRMDFIQVGDALPASFKMTLKRKSGDQAITVGSDRRFGPVPTSQDLAAKTMVEISAPKGTRVSLTVKLSSTMTPAKVMDAKALAAGVDQVRAGTKSMGGVMAFMIPNYQSVCFDGTKSGTVTLGNGTTSALKLSKKDGDAAKGSACFTPSEFKSAVQITLDRVPTGMYITPKPY